jgi:Tol biopolymer transport system component/DNA-binding winged helix-turn-helix (wHTH) protein
MFNGSHEQILASLQLNVTFTPYVINRGRLVLEPGTEAKASYRFGLYEVDPTRAKLTRQGIRLKLQDQPFRILILLLQKHGEIVTRDELRQTLWPKGTHVNFDGSLNAALKKLRAALQDDAENPRFIETVPRQGYRFLAPVQIINDAVASVQSGQVSRLENGQNAIQVRLHLRPELSGDLIAGPMWDRERAERTQRWFDAILLSVAILFGSWFLFFIVYPVPHPSMQRMTRITNAGRIDEWGGIVSDGTRIFFLERNAGHWNLMQTSVEGGNAEKMPAPFENTRLFAISPDHSQFLIGQFARRDEEMPLWLWPVQGGEPRRLGQAVGDDPAWSPDGTQIVYVHGQNLYTIRRDGTQMRQLAHVVGRPRLPAWSSDGSSIRFTLDLGEFGRQSIWEMTPEGNGLHAILSKSARPTYQSAGNWTEDGKYFLFSGCEDYSCNLWGIRNAWSWFRRSHHEPFPLTSGPDSLHVAIPAQMSSRIFAFSFRSHRELEKIEPRTQVTSTLNLDTSAAEASISPDGQLVAYSDRPDGSLWCSRPNGEARLRLATPPLKGLSPQWSPDSKQILFTGIREGQPGNIYVISPDGGFLHPVLPSGWEGTEADWSPDGYRIVVAMYNPKTQPLQALYTFEPTTGIYKALPDSNRLSEPRWSPDGRYIAALDETKRGLVIYDVRKGKWFPLVTGGLLGSLQWTQDASAIYFQDQLEEEESVYLANIGTRQTKKITGFGEKLRGSATHCYFSGVGNDGSIYVMVERGLTDIYALDLELP